MGHICNHDLFKVKIRNASCTCMVHISFLRLCRKLKMEKVESKRRLEKEKEKTRQRTFDQ